MRNRIRILAGVAVLAAGNILFAQTDISGGTSNISAMRSIMEDQMGGEEELSKYDREIREAYRYLGQQNLNEAYRHLNYAMAEDPNRPEAYIGFAAAARSKQSYRAAEKALLQAIDVAPENAQARMDLASLWLIKQTPEAALGEVEMAIEFDGGSNWKSQRIKAEALIAMDRLEEAAPVYVLARSLLADRLEKVSRAIRREATKEEVLEMHQETEYVYEVGGGIREVPVTRFDTVPKEVPAEWLTVEKRLKGHLELVEGRITELAEFVEIPDPIPTP